jgi:stage IV sporulation protein FB
MVQALSRSGPQTPVVETMATDLPTVGSSARLLDALNILQMRGAPAVGVLDRDGSLIGYITSENIGELMMVNEAGTSFRPRGTPRATAQ